MTPSQPTASASAADAQYIYDEWHRATTHKDVPALIALYRDDAVLETPMAIFLQGSVGELRGKQKIAGFLQTNFAKRETVQTSLDRARFYRTGYQFDGRRLYWEYLRETPRGESYDVAEMLEIEGRQIVAHRMYFGWYLIMDLLDHSANWAPRLK